MEPIRKCVRLSRKTLVLFQFLLDGHEGIATVSTLDREAAVVQILIMPDFVEEATIVLEALKNELDFDWVEI